LKIRLLSFCTSGGFTLTPRVDQMRSKQAPIHASEKREQPSPRQRASTGGGVRKQIALLMSVLPPTPRPPGSTVTALPWAARVPRPWYRCRHAQMLLGRNCAGCQCEPSSITATVRPRSVSAAAAALPPAPAPTIATSTSRSNDAP
jgi:hypothetical protein